MSRVLSPSARATLGDLFRGWQWVVFTFVASRLMIFAVIHLARIGYTRGQLWHPGGVFSVLLQFDAELWYIDIARRGYFYSDLHPSSMGFFPFYPMLIWAGSFLFGDMRVSAVAVAHICFLIAALLLNALINVDYRNERINRAAIAILMFSPVSFFFSHAYTESTFLMLAAGAFLAAIKHRWLAAALCGMCLSATRNIGMFIALPVFIEYLRHIWAPGFSWKALLHPRILVFALIPAGFGFFLLYGYFEFGDPVAYFTATEAGWRRRLAPPWETIANSKIHPPFFGWYWGITLSLGVLMCLAGFYMRIRASYMVWGGLLLTVYLCGNSLEAIPRYLSVVFPLFITAGLVANRFPSMYVPMLTGSTALLTLSTILSAIGVWIT